MILKTCLNAFQGANFQKLFNKENELFQNVKDQKTTNRDK